MRHRLALISASLVFALVAAACSSSDSTTSAEDPSPTTTTVPASSTAEVDETEATIAEESTEDAEIDWSEVDATVAEVVEANGLTGLGLAVVSADDGIVYDNYWGEFSADRTSFVASMSKQVTAGVLLRLDDEGVLDIDAPIADIVDDAWGSSDGNDTLGDRTIAQMLSHSAGMVGLEDQLYAPYFCQFAGTELEACGAEVYATADDDADVFEPDTEWVYGGAQWQLAGAIAEHASGESWEELVQRIYVEPCGLSEGFGFNNHWIGLGQASTDYPADFDGDLALLEPTENPHIEGGLYTTVVDYADLLVMYLRDGACPGGQVLSPEAIDEMHADRIAEVYGGEARNGNGYGLGWWVDRTNGNVFNDGAYGAQAWLELDDGYGVYFVVEEQGSAGPQLKDQLEPMIDELING